MAQGDFLVSGYLRSDYGPETQLRLYASPSAVPMGGHSTISAVLEGSAPAETVTFSAKLGAVSPAVATLVDGQASTTFTAGATEGTAVITATIDTLSESVAVQILGERQNPLYLPLITRGN